MNTTELAERFLSELTEDLQNNTLFLPTLPEVALQVRDVADNDNSTIRALADVVARDTALSARMVHVANSPLMRGARNVDSLEAAITRLGTKLVRDMVISIAMEQMFQATTDVTDRKLRQIWEHSVQVASISHALASHFTPLHPEQARLAGLLHDIGTLPILAKAEDMPELLEHEHLLDRIIHRLHPRIGEAILREWNFPEEMVAVAANHEDLKRESQEIDYVDVVTVANLQSYLGTDHQLARQSWHGVPALARLGLSPDVSVVDLKDPGEEIREMHYLLTTE